MNEKINQESKVVTGVKFVLFVVLSCVSALWKKITAEHVDRRVRQVSLASLHDSSTLSGTHVVFAVCEDGSLWQREYGIPGMEPQWVCVSEIPKT